MKPLYQDHFTHVSLIKGDSGFFSYFLYNILSELESLSDLMTLSLLVFESETKGPKNPMSVSQSASREFSTTVLNWAIRVIYESSNSYLDSVMGNLQYYIQS